MKLKNILLMSAIICAQVKTTMIPQTESKYPLINKIYEVLINLPETLENLFKQKEQSNQKVIELVRDIQDSPYYDFIEKSDGFDEKLNKDSEKTIESDKNMVPKPFISLTEDNFLIGCIKNPFIWAAVGLMIFCGYKVHQQELAEKKNKEKINKNKESKKYNPKLNPVYFFGLMITCYAWVVLIRMVVLENL